MNLKNYPRKNYELDQFTKPVCYELEGEKFYFVMRGGYDYELEFTGKETCAWNIAGEKPQAAQYQCLKADDTTYLVTFLVQGADPDICHTYVIETQQRLVTQLICTRGQNPRHPYLVSRKFDFGAIRAEGHALPFKRQYFTDDLIGTCVEWHWQTNLISRHAYTTTYSYKITWPDEGSMEDTFSEENEKIPGNDEVSQYIKIKDHMYLFVITEENVERVLGDDQLFRSDNMVFLQNYDRMYHVGRAFGAMVVDGKPQKLSMLFGAFGNPIVYSPEFLNAPNPFII